MFKMRLPDIDFKKKQIKIGLAIEMHFFGKIEEKKRRF